uniref:Halorhodopsin n=1 Tax=Haloterrigena sp. (strain arg-4) TaxID=160432 RepID=BACH_HALS4|nr:RecName: Full=Halorhodopsin; Short=HR [Haloterrigena sp. arg-4]pir/T43838/ halorhodopsin [similarity] - "Haloterrigena" sp. (strain arg-4) [Haloterrigena sp.]
MRSRTYHDQSVCGPYGSQRTDCDRDTDAGSDTDVHGAQVATQIRTDTLLHSSLWVNIALAGLSILVFLYMARTVRANRARLIVGATLMIPLVSLSSYLGLVTGLTAGPIEMPAAHALAGEDVLSQWGRYLTWTLSTPMILLALGWLAEVDTADLFVVIAADIGMCLTGLAAALTTSSYAFRWAFYLVSTAFFVVVLYALLAKWPTNAEAAGTGDIFGTLRWLTVILWLGYPILWALGVEGFALVDSVGLTSWGYSLLDIGAKYLFAALLLRWVANNERTIAVGQRSGRGAIGDPVED